MNSVEIIYRCEPGVPEGPRPTDPAAARTQLEAGNRALVSLLGSLDGEPGGARRVVHVDPHSLGAVVDDSRAAPQEPFAAVLSCSDARVPIEMIFNEGPNDLFVVRVAGNGLGSEVLGSLRYVTEHLASSVRLIVVLGHSGCGAVTAAADVFLAPRHYLELTSSHNLRTLIDRLQIPVGAAAKALKVVHGAGVADRPGYRAALIETSIAVNAALAAHTIAGELPRERLAAVWGVYLLGHHCVWSTDASGRDWTGLADPPRNEEEFMAFGRVLAGSDRIVRLLATAPESAPQSHE
jgi:carbonic anhydrase